VEERQKNRARGKAVRGSLPPSLDHQFKQFRLLTPLVLPPAAWHTGLKCNQTGTYGFISTGVVCGMLHIIYPRYKTRFPGERGRRAVPCFQNPRGLRPGVSAYLSCSPVVGQLNYFRPGGRKQVDHRTPRSLIHLVRNYQYQRLPNWLEAGPCIPWKVMICTAGTFSNARYLGVLTGVCPATIARQLGMMGIPRQQLP